MRAFPSLLLLSLALVPTLPATDARPPKKIARTGLPQAGEAFWSSIESLQRDLPAAVRDFAFDSVESWSLPAPEGIWFPTTTLGYGFNLGGYPTITKSAVPAFKAPPTLTGPAEIKSDVLFFESDEAVQNFLKGSNGINLGFSAGNFSIGLDFSSEHMSQQSSTSTKAYYVVFYTDLQTFSYGGSTSNFSTDASSKYGASDKAAFYRGYGTHYISAIRAGAALKVVYTISAVSTEVLKGFTDETGLSAGAGAFKADLKDKVESAMAKYSKTVNITSQVFANGNASLGMPATVALDYARLTKLSEDYVAKVGADRTGLPVVSFQIRPYKDLPPAAQFVVAAGASALADMSASTADINFFLRFPGFYTTSINAGTLQKILQLKTDEINAIESVINRSNPANIEVLSKATADWYAYVNGLDWPSFSNQVRIKFTLQPGPPKTLVPRLTIRKVPGYTLRALRVYAEKTDPVGPGEGEIPYSSLALAETDAPKPVVIDSNGQKLEGLEYVYGAVDVSDEAVKGKQIFLEAVDSQNRWYRYVIVLRVGGLRTDLDATERPMITVR